MRDIDTTNASATSSHASASALVHHAAPPASARELLARLGKALANAIDTVLDWHERARQRRQLMEMDDRMLKDIGLSRATARVEWRKPFWEP